jgi:predicted nucleotidyltransferase
MKLFVFGSVCTPFYNENSDIDFIVAFNEMEPGDYADNFFAFAEALETLLQKSVDLVSEKTISNPYFIKEIEETKSLLYAA